MANTFRGLLPDGTLPGEALAQVEALVGGLAVGVPIFQSLDEAEAWERDNPGRIALHIGGAPGGGPGGPTIPSGEPRDFTHQFLGGGATSFGWTDAKAGLSLPKEGSGSVAVSGGVASFSGDASYGPATIPFTDEPTITAVVRTLGTAYAFLAGQPVEHAVTAPSGGGDYTIGNGLPKGSPKPSGDWQIVTARWGKPGETQRAITVGTNTAAGTPAEEPPASMSFQIAGMRGSSNYRFDGDIREIRAYDRRLSDEEVYALHDALAARYGVTL